MQALTFHGKHDIRHETVPDPGITAPHEVILRVKACAICGSDLHIYHAHERGLDSGTVMGHEFIGEVVEVGKGIQRWRIGDRVMCPFTTSCGECFYCKKGLTCRCERGQFFGWVEKGLGLHGGQAEYVRVPLADQTLMAIPDGLPEEVALLLGDILSTGYFCADQADIHPEGVQVVVGCGPVGLMAIWAAQKLGARQLYAIDAIPERLALAAAWGATPLHLHDDNPLGQIRELTQGRGADSVLEVVGNTSAGRLAWELLRPGGTLSTVGVCNDQHLAFSPPEAYGKNMTYRVGRCPARHYMDRLVEAAREDAGQLAQIFSHQLPLDQGVEAYAMFAERRDNCLKVLLRP
ncbi:MAG: alcohol dehydrogenase catalytic domain-containing protein [Lewinellaceae bacterium]|nr:alcohol dehydrogenase catalytic domain-containing protein [Lewinellaceae bacterium]